MSGRGLRNTNQRLVVVVLLLLLAGAAGLALVQKWQGAAWWIVGGAAGLAAVLGGVGPLWQRWREQRAADAAVVRRSVNTADKTVTELSLDELRVHTAVVDVPYLARTAKEREVGEHLSERRPVLIVGPSMVGKTRLAAAVVGRDLPDKPLLLPDSPTALRDLDNADIFPRGQVIWLDDLERFFTGGGLSAGLVRRLCASNWLVATLRSHEWDRFQPTDQLRPPEWDVLRLFALVTLDRERDRPTDEDLREAVPDHDIRLRIARTGIGEYVGAAQHVRDQLTVGQQAKPLGYALIAAAADWSLIGITRPVPAELLPRLAAARLTGRLRTDLDNNDKYRAALEWATREINPTVSLLEPGNGTYRVYDYALEHLATTNRPVPAAAWQLAVDEAIGDELVSVGYQASVHHNLFDIAERAWRKAAEGSSADSMHNLGWLHEEQGDLAEAEKWYRLAGTFGHSKAMRALGKIQLRGGQLEGAETWYRRALDAGDTDAMDDLGRLHEERGDHAEAERWYRRAIDAGNAHAMNSLGVLHYQRGALTEAERWYRQATDVGNTEAMNNLGVLLEERGDHVEAEKWYRRAIDAGNPTVMHNLGWLLLQQGKLTEAERWIRQAIDAGNAEAMRNLGWLLRQRGEHVEADEWYRKADGSDAPGEQEFRSQ